MNSAFPLDLRYGEAYPRDVARSATTRPPMLAARSGFTGLGTKAPSHLFPRRSASYNYLLCAAGRPNKRGPWPGRSRPPSASVQRRIYSPRALQRTEFIIYRFCPRSPVASAEATRGAGLLLIMLNSIYAGGPVFIKNHPGVRCCGRRGGLFVIDV